MGCGGRTVAGMEINGEGGRGKIRERGAERRGRGGKEKGRGKAAGREEEGSGGEGGGEEGWAKGWVSALAALGMPVVPDVKMSSAASELTM